MVARSIIVDRGSDELKMSEIASLANIPVGSIYQYFPDKAAILRELALRFMVDVRSMLEATLVDLQSPEDAIERLDSLLARYYQLLVTDPEMRDVWSSTQGDKQLRELDIADSRSNGDYIASCLQRFVRPSDMKQLGTIGFLFAHLAGTTARLALAVGSQEGEALMTEHRIATRQRLEDLLLQ